jgi:hypothetical protein
VKYACKKLGVKCPRKHYGGRPRIVDTARAAELRATGMKWDSIAKELGVSSGAVVMCAVQRAGLLVRKNKKYSNTGEKETHSEKRKRFMAQGICGACWNKPRAPKPGKPGQLYAECLECHDYYQKKAEEYRRAAPAPEEPEVFAFA